MVISDPFQSLRMPDAVNLATPIRLRRLNDGLEPEPVKVDEVC